MVDGTQGSHRKEGSRKMTHHSIRAAGIDTGKHKLDVALADGLAEIQVGNDTAGHRELVAWLQGQGITHVVMESTGVYWKPVYNLLRPHFVVWIVNAHHLAQVPGRKTDDTDAMWLTKLMRYGLLTPSFIPDAWQRDLRDATPGALVSWEWQEAKPVGALETKSSALR